MSHEFEKGFSVREAAWHGLATVLDEYPGREEAMRMAGHDFNIIEAPVKVKVKGENGKQIWIDHPKYKGIVRDDNNHIICLAPSSYPIIPNATMWDIVDAIVDQNHVQYETAGVLKDGAILWVLARVDEPEQIKGDDSPIYPYCLVATTHDGSGACRASCVSVRVICWNTFNSAVSQSDKSGLQYSFKHTKNVMERITEAKEALGLVKNQFSAFIELSRELGKLTVTNDGVKDFLSTFIPDPPADVMTQRGKTHTDNARAKVMAIMDSKTIPEAHKRTSYGLFCAGIEYLDYMRRSNSPETSFRRTIYDVSSLKPKVAKLAMKVAR